MSNKYSLFPVKHQNLWDAYKNQMNVFWTVDDIVLDADMPDIEKLSMEEMHFLTHVLAFFAQSDGIVNENLAIRFYNDVEIPEARAFYTMQLAIETIHAETYGLLIESYVKDQAEKDRLFNAIETIPAVKKKAEWALKWIDSQDSFAKRLVAFAVVEGVFFSGSFCAIYWLKKRGLLPGLAKANEFIARDEGLHWQFAAMLFKEMGLKLTQQEFEEIIKEAVTIEHEFVSESLPVGLIGMNATLMCQYIEYVADRVGHAFGMQAMYNKTNPFDFMVMIDMESKTNFFERKVANYSKSQDRELTFDADF